MLVAEKEVGKLFGGPSKIRKSVRDATSRLFNFALPVAAEMGETSKTDVYSSPSRSPSSAPLPFFGGGFRY